VSEPCPSCQRLRAELAEVFSALAALKADYARDGIRDVVREVKAHEATKRELTMARLEVSLLKSEVIDFERLEGEALATLAKVAAIVADPNASAFEVDRIRGVLEPTPKGKP